MAEEFRLKEMPRVRSGISIVSDDLIALCIAGAVFLLHAISIPAIARGTIFHKSNLAFDFDIARFVNIWCVRPFMESENEAYYAARHPLAISVRLLCLPLVQTGIDPHIAACGIAAACAALSAALVYRIARALEIENTIACAFAALWSISTTTLVLGVLPESYCLALVALAYQFLLTIRWAAGQPASLVTRIATGVANFGITITNVVFSGLAELFSRIAREPLRKALLGTTAFSVYVGIVAVVLSVISLSVWPSQDIGNPTSAAKQVYWSASAYSADQRQDVGNVAWEFGATSFVAPAMARFPSGVPTNPYLWDFRGQNYTAVGWAAVLGWLALLAYGAIAAIRDRQRWPVWALAAAWIAFNIGLHSYWQFRGSIFLYAGHPHIGFLVLALAGAPRTRNPHIYAALVAAVALLIAVNNMPMYLTLSELN